MTAVHPIRLFVYGTLKRGQANHARFCSNAIDIVPAVTWGRLYALDLGFPSLEVPPSLILAEGTGDPVADAATQAGWPEVGFVRPEGDWDPVEGELMTFADPGRYLPPIDWLEGFRPAGRGYYRWVLVPVLCAGQATEAWTYDGAPLTTGGTRIVPRHADAGIVSGWRCRGI